MSTLLEISVIARSNDLKDMMVVLFESENQKDLITANNMNIVAKNLATHVRERDQLIGELDNCLGSTTAYESAKLLREMNDDDLAKARFGVFSFSCCSKGDMKFKDRVFPHRVIFMGRLMVNEVDDILMRLVDSLESWNAFSWGEHIWMHLYDEFLNVVFNHKSEHLEGLHKSRNYVPTYTLSGFVWAFKPESNPISDLRPTLPEYKSE
uniref:Phospholipase-like protein n=1 Tax=Tanacetum cinerariifolium TaxID=118510 RepID=A0A699HS27_TANCI|nr:phospholipase-like protein [Tanacetum cinerariifolium]